MARAYGERERTVLFFLRTSAWAKMLGSQAARLYTACAPSLSLRTMPVWNHHLVHRGNMPGGGCVCASTCASSPAWKKGNHKFCRSRCAVIQENQTPSRLGHGAFIHPKQRKYLM
eukprot:1961053-Alexandrium_andersonii.AAC.1